MWESGKLDTRLMFCSSCQIELGGFLSFLVSNKPTHWLLLIKSGWLVMLSPLLVALSNIQVLPLLATLDKLQLLPTS